MEQGADDGAVVGGVRHWKRVFLTCECDRDSNSDSIFLRWSNPKQRYIPQGYHHCHYPLTNNICNKYDFWTP